MTPRSKTKKLLRFVVGNYRIFYFWTFQVLDGEYLVSVAQNPELFYFAKLLLDQLQTINNSFTKSFVSFKI
jgi:hypothetical protein